MTLVIVKEDNPSIADDAALRKGIIEFNAKVLGERAEHFSIFLKDEAGTIQGGVLAWTRSESVYIDVLWVTESLRGQGYGTRLLHAAEEEAKKRKAAFFSISFSSLAIANSLCNRLFSSINVFISLPLSASTTAAELDFFFSVWIQVCSVAGGMPNSSAILVMLWDFNAKLTASCLNSLCIFFY